MRIKVKRNRIDKCNICLKEATLTWDHIPPQGGIDLKSLKTESLFSKLTGKKDDPVLYSQNGLKYRTICARCNSKLGTSYDVYLNALNRQIIKFCESSLILPNYTFIKVKPNRIIRSVLGHIAAAKVNLDENKFDQFLRVYLNNEESKLPNNIHVHYWLYPYDSITVLRDFALINFEQKEKVIAFCHIVKYFPLAFIISDNLDLFELDSLSKYKNESLDFEAELKIVLDRKKIRQENWPESPSEVNIVMLTNESLNSTFSIPKK